MSGKGNRQGMNTEKIVRRKVNEGIENRRDDLETDPVSLSLLCLCYLFFPPFLFLCYHIPSLFHSFWCLSVLSPPFRLCFLDDNLPPPAHLSASSITVRICPHAGRMCLCAQLCDLWRREATPWYWHHSHYQPVGLSAHLKIHEYFHPYHRGMFPLSAGNIPTH
jgi:hypothetical protein